LTDHRGLVLVDRERRRPVSLHSGKSRESALRDGMSLGCARENRIEDVIVLRECEIRISSQSCVSFLERFQIHGPFLPSDAKQSTSLRLLFLSILQLSEEGLLAL
jgi:hypothetical protein